LRDDGVDVVNSGVGERTSAGTGDDDALGAGSDGGVEKVEVGSLVAVEDLKKRGERVS
jgi:hypothetical protein